MVRALVFVLVAACSKESRSPAPKPSPQPSPQIEVTAPKLKPAPRPVWDTQYSVQLTLADDPELAQAKCKFTLAPTFKDTEVQKQPRFEIDCDGSPRPEMAVEGLKPTERRDYDFNLMQAFEGEVLEKLGGVPLDALLEQNNMKFVLPFKVTLRFPGYEPLVVVPPMWWVSGTVLDGWHAGVSFANPEPADDGKLQAILLGERYGGRQVFGAVKGAKLTDLDWIIMKRDKLDGKKLACQDGLNILLEATVTTYERRTGAIVDEHPMISEKAGCQARGLYALGTTEDRSGISPKDVTKYVEKLVSAQSHGRAAAKP
jgi:hypothetical protein